MDLIIHEFAQWGKRQVYMLREDLLPLACGGNKVRIALRLIEDAKTKGATAIIGYGNSRSNLCRVLSMLCAREHIHCVIISPSDGDGRRIETTNSFLVRFYGAEVVACPKTAFVADVVQDVFDRLSANGHVPYYIFGDKFGSGNERILMSAYEDVAQKILAWENVNGMTFDRVALAVGTGSTYAGLLSGFRKCGSHKLVTGFTIARDCEHCISALQRFSEHQADISDIALNGGYSKTSTAEVDFLRKIMFDSAILLDPTYAGKALWGLSNYPVTTPERTLFVHTGSLPLAFDSIASMNWHTKTLKHE